MPSWLSWGNHCWQYGALKRGGNCATNRGGSFDSARIDWPSSRSSAAAVAATLRLFDIVTKVSYRFDGVP